MNTAIVLLAPGFEEIEAITVIDLLRRAGIEVTIAGLVKGTVTGSHDISVMSNIYYKDVDPGQFEMMILPGGQPGTNNLKNDPVILEWLAQRYRKGKKIAAICAAPSVLYEAGITNGLNITSYPSEKPVFSEASYCEDSVVVDGGIITSRGVGTAIDFSLAIIAVMQGQARADEIAEKILYKTNKN